MIILWFRRGTQTGYRRCKDKVQADTWTVAWLTEYMMDEVWVGDENGDEL